MTSDRCDVCERAWEVLFEWDYTGPERYCRHHLLEPIDDSSLLLDYMPDCQRITHRLTRTSRPVHYGSTHELYPILLSRVRRG